MEFIRAAISLIIIALIFTLMTAYLKSEHDIPFEKVLKENLKYITIAVLWMMVLIGIVVFVKTV